MAGNQGGIKIPVTIFRIIMIKCQIYEHPKIDHKLLLERDEYNKYCETCSVMPCSEMLPFREAYHPELI